MHYAKRVMIMLAAGTVLSGSLISTASAAPHPADKCQFFCVSDGKPRTKSDGGGFFGSKGKRSNPPSFDWGGGWGDLGKAPKKYRGGWGAPMWDTPKHKSPKWDECVILCG